MKKLISAWLALICIGAVPVQGEIIYGNLDEQALPEFYSAFWYFDPADPALLTQGRGTAARFTVPTGMSYRLESVTLALNFLNPGYDNLEISLRYDNAGLPGDNIETISVNPPSLENRVPPRPSTYASSLSPVLDAGTSYWLLVQPHRLNLANQTENGFYDWAANYLHAPGSVAWRDYDYAASDWRAWFVVQDVLPAFRIEGAAVPEPSTWALLGLGGALLWPALRRRGK